MDKLNKAENIDIVKVPYRGGGEVVNALLGGTTQIAVLALSNMVPQLQSGRITPLAVVANSRSPLFPDVPTLEEARGEDFPTTWFGLFTQTGVPRPIVEKIAHDADRIMAEPAFRKRMYTDRARRARVRAARRVCPLHPRGAQARAADRQGIRARTESQNDGRNERAGWASK